MAKNSKMKGNHQTPKSKAAKTKTTQPNTPSWPNLPRQLRNYIAMQPSLLNNITSFGCIIKSWRSSSSRCKPIINGSDINTPSQFPKLVEIINDKETQRSYTLDIKFHERWPFPYWKPRRYKREYQPGGSLFKGCSHGQVTILGGGDKDSELCLWKPADSCSGYLPPWDHNIPFKSCATTVFPNYPNQSRLNVMVITGISSPAFAFYSRKKGGKSWVLQDCKIKEPYAAPNESMQFTNCIELKGKFYALSLQGSLVEIDQDDDDDDDDDDDGVCCFNITRVSVSRAVPSKVSRQFREYLLESNGEVLLVFLVSRKSINVVDDVEVYRLDVEKLLWVKAERIGERALFLEDECCMSVLASEIGCMKNCVYFTHDRVVDGRQWWIYNMETQEISRADEIREGVMWGEPMEKVKCRCAVDYRHW